MDRKTTIVGIGNTLLTDEGIGVFALSWLQQRQPELTGIQYVDGGTLGFSLAPWLDEADHLIVLDAAQLKAEPGTVRLMEGDEMDRYIATGKHSAHDVGFLDLLSINRMHGELPAYRALIGVQPGEIGWGTAPSERVQQSLPEIERIILDLLQRWENRDVENEYVH